MDSFYVSQVMQFLEDSINQFPILLQVLDTDDVLTSATGAEKKNLGNHQSKAPESATSEGRSGSIDIENDVKEHKAKSREKFIRRVEAKKLGSDKKRKSVEKKTDVHKQSKLAKKQSGENSDADNERGVSEDGESQSSEEKPAKVTFLYHAFARTHAHKCIIFL